MAKAVRFYQAGGPEVLRYEDVEVGEPGPGQVRLRHVAVGLNFADTYFRNGTYPVPLPERPRRRGRRHGRRPSVRASETSAVGDRVSYTGFLNTLGAYSTERLISAAPLIKLPRGHRLRDGRRDDDARPDRRVSAAAHLPIQARRHRAAARRCGRRRPDRRAVGEAAGPDGHRHGLDRAKGRGRPRARLRSHHQLQPRGRGAARARADRRRGRGRGVRQRRQEHLHGLAGLAQAPRADGLRRHRLGHDPAVRSAAARDEGLAVPDAPGARRLHRGPGREGAAGARAVRPRRPRAASRSRSTSTTPSRTRCRRIATWSRARRPARRSSSSERSGRALHGDRRSPSAAQPGPLAAPAATRGWCSR